jgi:RNA polymerase sigma factor (sigma-70 family)
LERYACRRQHLSVDDARDAVAEAFVRVWTRRADTELEHLFTLLRDHVRDFARRERRRAMRVSDVDVTRAGVAGGGPETLLIGTELAADCGAAIAALRPMLRQVCQRALLDGESCEQIAADLGKSLKVVMNLRAEGRRLLRARLALHLDGREIPRGRGHRQAGRQAGSASRQPSAK